MSQQQLTPAEIKNILESESYLKLYLDSNVIIAYLDKNHRFNYEATVIIDPLKKKECWFFIHYIVLGEFISKWREIKKVSVNATIKTFSTFIDSLEHWLWGGQPLNVPTILDSYRKHAKHKTFLKAHFNDFIILTEAELIKNIKIVTCDKDMYDAGKHIFKKNIYYLPFNTRKGKSDLSRFISDMEGLV